MKIISGHLMIARENLKFTALIKKQVGIVLTVSNLRMQKILIGKILLMMKSIFISVILEITRGNRTDLKIYKVNKQLIGDR